MKQLVIYLFLVNILFASNEKIDDKIINLLNEVKHNKSHIMKKIAFKWSDSLYKRQGNSILDINRQGNFKNYLPDKLKNYDGGLIGSRGKYWVYTSIKKTCLVWKGIVEKNGVKLNKYYPDICKNPKTEMIGAIVYETAIGEKKLSKGFWSLSSFELKSKDILKLTNFQGTMKWYIQKEKPNQLKQEKAFRDAVYKNDIAKLQNILNHNITINMNEMFLLAVEVSDLNTVKFLLDNGSDINYKNNFGNALSKASGNDSNLDKIKYILKSGFIFDKGSLGDKSPIYGSAQTRQIKLINFWLENGIDINLQKSNGRTPIFDVCRNRKNIFAGITYYDTLKLLKFMTSKGANPIHMDKRGTTTLHLISEKGELNQVKYISSFFKDINIQDNFLQTPLHHAARNIQYNNKERIYNVIKYLLSKGADKNIKDKMKRTPYDIVNKMKFPDKKILSLLKS
jgi:ankyrin repeat protein